MVVVLCQKPRSDDDESVPYSTADDVSLLCLYAPKKHDTLNAYTVNIFITQDSYILLND